MSDDRRPGRGVLGALPGASSRPTPTCSATTAAPASSRTPPGRPRTREIAAHARLRAARRGDRRVRPRRPAADHPRRADRRRHRPGRPAGGPARRARRRPDLRPAGRDADPDGDARAADAGRGRGAGRQAARPRVATTASSPSASARASPPGGCPPRSRCADTVAQLDGLLATPIADDPLLQHDAPAVRARRRRLEGPAARGDRVRRTSRHGGLPRRAARRGARPGAAPTSSAA